MRIASEMNRRSFLKGAAALTMAGPVGAGALRGGPAAESGYLLGCYTRPWDQHDYRVALDSMAEAGYRYAGIMTAQGKSWVVITVQTTPEEAAVIGGEVTQRGLKTLSVYADFSVTESVAKAVEGLRRLIDNCAACGSPNLLLGGTSNEAHVQPYYRAVAECCDYAAGKKVALSVKPHGGQNATGPQCRKIIERVAHRNFGLWYDPGNIFYYSDAKLDPVDDSATVDGLVVGMSVKDFLPPKEVLVTPGTGRVDFPKVMANLRRGGFTRGPLLVECLARGELADITRQARQAREYLEKLTAALA